jgi:GDP-mannose 6-dehydrogenase
VATPILEGVIESNARHMQRAYDLVVASGHRRIGLFGLAFKTGTDDLRESPMVALAERLLGTGYELLIHDADVASSHLLGANRDFVESHIPHLSRLLRRSVDDVLAHAQVCVVGSTGPETAEAIRASGDRVVIDLVRLPGADTSGLSNYRGICW